jgi:6-phosphofructokinase 1
LDRASLSHAGGAHIILIPKIAFTMKNVCDFIAHREKHGSRFTIVVVAEGIKLPRSS